MEITVIGTNPPCPRCDLVGLYAEELVEELGLDATVNHFAWDTDEGANAAKACGYSVGTAHQVAPAAGMDFDGEAISAIIARLKEEAPDAKRPADIWQPALDEEMMKYADAAPGISYVMTPVLIKDQEVLSQGYVPSKDQMKEWLSR